MLKPQCKFEFATRRDTKHGRAAGGHVRVSAYRSPGETLRTRRIWLADGALCKCVYCSIGIHIVRTNIVIDDKLMRDALRATGMKTKREAVEEGLRTLLRLKRQEEIRKVRGKLVWRGDLDEMRTDR